ncbi:MAG TPA: YraN family protein [Chloroflexota bacterium]|jgi:putative endonuclease|nr:YraN family protein [Chloroflexota bacterium]
MSGERRRLGAAGEQLAAEWLEGLGYRILARNYRCALGEVDLVVADGAELVFVEVRTRRVGGMVAPAESVTQRKQQRLVRAAEHYLQTVHGSECPWRVDVIALEMDSAGRLRHLEHLRGVVE